MTRYWRECERQSEDDMTVPSPPTRPLHELQYLTPARVALGRTGVSLPTQALLEFTLDHARARDAVHAPFNALAILRGLEAMGLETVSVSSQSDSRHDYLRRPDFGRKLAATSRDLVAQCRKGAFDLAVVIGDGLSPAAVNAHAVELIRNLTPRLHANSVQIGIAVVASGARVALGDEIGLLLGARAVLMLIGERPGLSVPKSMGAYLTYAPASGLTDAHRNCISNIHGSGLSYDEAAFKIAWLIREALVRQVSGVALKDESGLARPLHLGGTLKQA
jgi:ethanolamine ammonia-lyase small subunit